MLAQARGPDPLGPSSAWTSTICDLHHQELKHPGRLQRPGELQCRASSHRSCFLGVETCPELVWEDWDLGRDFTKKLVLKNNHNKLQKLRFRPPVSRFFSTMIPQIIALSPGKSFSMPVTFRPLERREYEDDIEFQVKDGSFQVRLRAVIPCHALEVPESVLLPVCAVQHSSCTTFLFRNASKLQTCFQWECEAPFQLSPERGLLKPGQERRVTVVFRPQGALVYQQEACCRFGGEGEEAQSRCTVLLQGPAKYPFLQLRNPDRQEEEEPRRLRNPDRQEEEEPRRLRNPDRQEEEEPRRLRNSDRQEEEEPRRLRNPDRQEEEEPRRLRNPDRQEEEEPRRLRNPDRQEEEEPRRLRNPDRQEQEEPRRLRNPDRQEEEEPRRLRNPDRQEEEEPRRLRNPDRQEEEEPRRLRNPDRQEGEEPRRLRNPDRQEEEEPRRLRNPDRQEEGEPRRLRNPDRQEEEEPRRLRNPDRQEEEEPRRLRNPDRQEGEEPRRLRNPDRQEEEEPRRLRNPDRQEEEEPRRLRNPDRQEEEEPRRLRNPDRQEEEEPGSPALHFGRVAVGSSVQKYFDILNPSPVTASFSLSRLRGGVPLLGAEFSCDVTEGSLVPGASLRASVTYTPTAVDAVSVEYLSLACPGALGKTLLKLTGKCIGPVVSLSSSVVDFGCVGEGGEVVRTVTLVNSSPADAVYQWDLDCSGHSVFSVQPAGGRLSPHSHTTLKLVYRPTHPLAHHRRLACLILHRDPVFLDVIGTCHSELQQPSILRPRHLSLYRLHRQRRLTQYPPHLLSTMLQDRKVQLDQDGALGLLEEEPDQEPGPMNSTPMEELYQACSGGMDPISSLTPHVTVEPAELLFNHRPSTSMSSSSSFSQSVSITNHTKGKLGLVWTAARDSPFSVSPSSCDLGVLKSTCFRVTYAPQQLNTLHGAQLECFAFYKMLQDHRQLEERLLCPPWCVTVRVVGHSFQPGREHFVPCCTLQHPRVVFPGLNVLSYRTVLLHNSGDLPLTFHLDPDQSPNPDLAASVFTVPSCGLVQPGDHQILTLRTTPTEDSPKQGFSLTLQLNAAKHTQDLLVVSTVEKLRVSMEGDGTLHFQPTAVGSRTERPYRIRNLSRLPLRFQWSIPRQDQKLISVEPDVGELQPNESMVQKWSFSPLEETMYTLKPCLTFWPTQTPGCKKYIPLKVMGMGSTGFIEAEKAVLELGEILVGSCRSVEIPLVNRSLCAVSFCLSVRQTLWDKGRICDPHTEPEALQLDSVRGTVPSRTKMLLRSTVRPHRGGCYQWTISYQTMNTRGSVWSPPQEVCEVRGKGVFPTMQVIDARSGGSVGGLSKVQLWSLFSLDGLNKHLLCSPSPPELTYTTPTRHSLHRCPSILTVTLLEFNFSAAPLGSDPSTVLLVFHNPGSIPVDWAFVFPEDQQIELEYWAETGEFSSTELHQMKIQDNCLFSVSPRRGNLLPGQQRAVHLSYRHDFAGTDRLPVLLKLSHGREILLTFQGVTVERDRPYLHYASRRHVFTPVTFGGFNPPRQVYELYNGGAVPVFYEVDVTPLKQLQADNFNQPVLRCLNPQGDVLPGKTAMLEWIFSPLEAKTYNVDIPIHIQGGESTLVTFEGFGVDPRAPGSSNLFHSRDAPSSLPCVQRTPLPGQVVFLSEERVSLGDIPVCSLLTRILFLTNVSHTASVSYEWELPQLNNQQVVQIHPEQGRLCPGESALCVLTLRSTSYPAFYQLDLICQITQEAELSQYRDAVRRWEEERERQLHEFTLTEKDLGDRQADPVALRSGPPLRKYQTLPPIRASSGGVTVTAARPTRAEWRAQREAGAVRRRPEPPNPNLLHLGVTARSHGLLEYNTHFPNQLNKHYAYRYSVYFKLNINTSPPSAPLPAGLPPLPHGPERDIAHTLTSLLRTLLDDPAFHQSLAGVASEPAPYFSQLRGTAPPAASSPSPCLVHPAGPTSSSCPPPSPPRLLPEVLLNTLQNLMMESFLGDFVLTAPHTIARPPASARWKHVHTHTQEEEEEEEEEEGG
ncbi:LOW QUALITY PROTEIN: cilia- and flagella-associated protein 65 [Diretmus argenteus]